MSQMKRMLRWIPFHHLDKFPQEVRDLVWEHAFYQEDGYSTNSLLKVREAGQERYHETMEVFFKRAFLHFTPEKDERWWMWDLNLSPAFASEIKNVDITLSYFREHKWRYYDATTRCSTLEFLKDEAGMLEALVSQSNDRRKKCILRGVLDVDVFRVPDHIMENLLWLTDFETVIFKGKWSEPNLESWQVATPPEKPFEDFKGELEEWLGPAVCLDEDPLNTEFEFHPRRFLEDWYREHPEEI